MKYTNCTKCIITWIQKNHIEIGIDKSRGCILFKHVLRQQSKNSHIYIYIYIYIYDNFCQVRFILFLSCLAVVLKFAASPTRRGWLEVWHGFGGAWAMCWRCVGRIYVMRCRLRCLKMFDTIFFKRIPTPSWYTKYTKPIQSI